MKTIASALAATVALLLSGCIVERPYESLFGDEGAYEPYSSFSNFTDDNVQLVRGHLTGDIGPMRGFDDPAQLNGYHDEGFTSVEVVVADDRGAAMALLDVHGGINHPALRPGASFTFTRSDLPENEGELYVTGLGCAGNSVPGDWDYDRPLEEVRVQVEETDNPDVMRVNFTTYTRDDEAHGFVDVAVQE